MEDGRRKREDVRFFLSSYIQVLWFKVWFTVYRLRVQGFKKFKSSRGFSLRFTVYVPEGHHLINPLQGRRPQYGVGERQIV